MRRNLRDFHDAYTGWSRIYAVGKGSDHLRKFHQAEAERGWASGWKLACEPVSGDEKVRPIMARTENVPGAKDRGVQSTAADHLLALRSHFDVRLHGGSGMGDADIDKVTGAVGDRCGNRFFAGFQIDFAELLALRGTGMRDAHKLNVDGPGWNSVDESCAVESVAWDGLASCGDAPF